MQDSYSLSFSGVPHPDGLVTRARRDPSAIRTECNAVNVILMLHLLELLPSGRIPKSRRVIRATMRFLVVGDVPEQNVRRALDMSRDTYCSAWNSLRQDTELLIETAITPPPSA